MTCKDCVHYDLCRSCSRIQLGWHGNSVRYVENIEEICKDFTDRSRFVELPCKVGDAVYKICPVEEGEECNNCPWEYCECYDIGFIKDRHNSIRKGMIHNLVWLIKRMPYFGEIYFTNYENAEKALKEREENA